MSFQRLRISLASALFVPVLMAALAGPVRAQVVAEFTKDDCNAANSLCPALGDCDDVRPAPGGAPTDRIAYASQRVQYLLRVVNDGDPNIEIELFDHLPPCAVIDCWNPCVDTDCDGVPDREGIHVTVSGEAMVAATCTSRPRLTLMNLGPDEIVEVRFCADLRSGEPCCNDATLFEGGRPGQSAVDAQNAGVPEMCIEVDPGVTFWKDDCGPRTGDPADCDDVLTNARGERAADRPVFGKRVKWVLHAENDGPDRTFSIRDQSPLDHYVVCDPS